MGTIIPKSKKWVCNRGPYWNIAKQNNHDLHVLHGFTCNKQRKWRSHWDEESMTPSRMTPFSFPKLNINHVKIASCVSYTHHTYSKITIKTSDRDHTHNIIITYIQPFGQARTHSMAGKQANKVDGHGSLPIKISPLEPLDISSRAPQQSTLRRVDMWDSTDVWSLFSHTQK